MGRRVFVAKSESVRVGVFWAVLFTPMASGSAVVEAGGVGVTVAMIGLGVRVGRGGDVAEAISTRGRGVSVSVGVVVSVALGEGLSSVPLMGVALGITGMGKGVSVGGSGVGVPSLVGVLATSTAAPVGVSRVGESAVSLILWRVTSSAPMLTPPARMPAKRAELPMRARRKPCCPAARRRRQNDSVRLRVKKRNAKSQHAAPATNRMIMNSGAAVRMWTRVSTKSDPFPNPPTL